MCVPFVYFCLFIKRHSVSLPNSFPVYSSTNGITKAPPLFISCSQVSDFLSGRSPLTLALRVGDHMMFVQLQLAAQHSGGPQLQHRHLISRGSSEGTTGQSHGASGSGMARVSHNPHPHHPHPHPHHPNTKLPSNPAAFPPSPSIPPVPSMYPTSASGHCSPPPNPSQLPGSFLHSPQSSSACPTSPSSPSPAASCQEVSHCFSYIFQFSIFV